MELNNQNSRVAITERKLSDNTILFSSTDSQGSITHANDELIKISGFSGDELLHKNHNVIRHPDMPRLAFADLWSTLKRGESWMGLIKNRCKNGDYYWVNAFVSPVQVDDKTVHYDSVQFKPDKTLIEGAEKTYEKLAQESNSINLKTTGISLQSSLYLGLAVVFLPFFLVFLLATNLSPVVSTEVFSGMFFFSCLVIRHLTQGIALAVNEARRIVNNDLMQHIYTGRADQGGQLLLAYKLLKTKIRAICGRITESSRNLEKNAGNLDSSLVLTNQGIKYQSSEIENAVHAIDEMALSAREIAKNSSKTLDAVTASKEQLLHGNHVVKRTIDIIQTLAEEVNLNADLLQSLVRESKSIGSVVDVINDIAGQTNLLALNAAIEAARAGENGRGFAVVADEVRTLASRTQMSTKEIQESIQRLQNCVNAAAEKFKMEREQANAGVQQVFKTGETFGVITSAINTINDMNAQIASAAEEQSAKAAELKKNVDVISEVVEMTIQGSQTAKAASEESIRMAEQLRQLAVQLGNEHL